MTTIKYHIFKKHFEYFFKMLQKGFYIWGIGPISKNQKQSFTNNKRKKRYSLNIIQIRTLVQVEGRNKCFFCSY